MNSIRTFIAVDIKPEKPIVELCGKLKLMLKNDSINWVDTNTIHLTLLFLGETQISQVEDISRALRDKLANISGFRLCVKGLGTFGKPHPKVIWLGIEPCQSLDNLKNTVDRALAPFGYEDENKAFSPHLTLGRIKFLNSRIELKSFVVQNKETILQNANIDKVVFYQSTLTPHGPIYKSIDIIDLKNS